MLETFLQELNNWYKANVCIIGSGKVVYYLIDLRTGDNLQELDVVSVFIFVKERGCLKYYV